MPVGSKIVLILALAPEGRLFAVGIDLQYMYSTPAGETWSDESTEWLEDAKQIKDSRAFDEIRPLVTGAVNGERDAYLISKMNLNELPPHVVIATLHMSELSKNVAATITPSATLLAAQLMSAGFKIYSFAHTRGSELLSFVTPLKQFGESGSSVGKAPLPFHTDEVVGEHQPEVTGLLCVRAATNDNVSTIIVDIGSPGVQRGKRFANETN